MRVALVCTEKLPVPAVRGGAIQILIEAMAPLLAKVHEVTVYCIADPLLADRETREGVRYVRLPKVDYYAHVASELARERYDIVHLHNRPRELVNLKRAAPDSRFVVSLHNEMFHREKLTPVQARRVVETASAIVTVSAFIAGTVARRVPSARKKLVVVHSAADVTRYQSIWDPAAASRREQVRRELGIHDKKVLLYVGRLTDKKGAHLLLHAFGKLREAHPDACVLIVGSKWFGDDTPDEYVLLLRKLAEPFGDAVRFTGFVPPDKIHDYYLAGDVLVCPAVWNEPLARVLYEGMASGLPIVTTRRGGNPEVVKDGVNGLVIPRVTRLNLEPLIVACDRLLADETLREQFGRMGRSTAEKRYNWKRLSRDVLRVWDRVAATPVTPVPPLRRRRKSARPLSRRPGARRSAERV